LTNSSTTTLDQSIAESAIKQFFGGSKYMIDYERNLIVAQALRSSLK
jgi:hypothetical protein